MADNEISKGPGPGPGPGPGRPADGVRGSSVRVVEPVESVPVWVWHTTQECGRGDGRCVTGWFDGQAEGRWYERPGCAGLWRMIRFAGTGGTNHHYMAIRAQHLRKREDGDQRPGDVPG